MVVGFAEDALDFLNGHAVSEGVVLALHRVCRRGEKKTEAAGGKDEGDD
jgi:hypothetical protein